MCRLLSHTHSVNTLCTVFDTVVLMFELFFVASVSVDGLFYGRANDHISIKFALRSVLIFSKDFVLIFAHDFFLHKLIPVSFLFLFLIWLVYHTIWIYDILIAKEEEEVAEDNRHLVFWHFFLSSKCVFFCGLSRFEKCVNHHHHRDYDVGTIIAMINAVLKMIRLINIF